MARSKTTKELLALGGKLVDQFGIRKDEDTLGQWIAHHLAEKLTSHQKASGAAKAALEAELIDTILKFWKQRAYFPRGTRPFEGYEAVLRALESFDPKPDKGRYFLYQGADELAKGAKPPSQPWIDTAKTFDRGARAMISFCFKQAARASEQPDDVWLAAAKVLAEDMDRDFLVVRFLSTGEKEKDEKIDPLEFEKKQLKAKREDLLRLVSGGVFILKLIDDRLEGLGQQTATSAGPKRKSRPSSKAKSAVESKPKKKANKLSISKRTRKKTSTRKRAGRHPIF
jgi:hypothetical protein